MPNAGACRARARRVPSSLLQRLTLPGTPRVGQEDLVKGSDDGKPEGMAATPFHSPFPNCLKLPLKAQQIPPKPLAGT